MASGERHELSQAGVPSTDDGRRRTWEDRCGRGAIAKDPPFAAVVGDAVRVTSGKSKGRAGQVTSLFSIDPVTTYLIEPAEEPWGDFQIAQSDLELID